MGGLIKGPPVRPLSRVHNGSVDSTLSLPVILLLGVERGGEGVKVIAEAFGVAIRSLTGNPVEDCFWCGVESRNRTRLLTSAGGEGATKIGFFL